MNSITEKSIRDIVRRQLVEKYGALNEQTPKDYTENQVKALQQAMIDRLGHDAGQPLTPAEINAALNVKDGKTDGDWGGTSKATFKKITGVKWNGSSHDPATAMEMVKPAQAQPQPSPPALESVQSGDTWLVNDPEDTVHGLHGRWVKYIEDEEDPSLIIIATGEVVAPGAEPAESFKSGGMVIVDDTDADSRPNQERVGLILKTFDNKKEPWVSRQAAAAIATAEVEISKDSPWHPDNPGQTSQRVVSNAAGVEERSDEEAVSAARVKAAEEAAAKDAEAQAKAEAERAEAVKSADEIGADVAIEDVKMELLTVDSPPGSVAFKIRLPSSFIGQTEDDGETEQQRGFIGRIFNQDTLQKFQKNPQATGKDQPFIVNWGAYSGRPTGGRSMFAQDQHVLSNIKSIEFDAGLSLRSLANLKGQNIHPTYRMIKGRISKAKKAEKKARKAGKVKEREAEATKITTLNALKNYLEDEKYEILVVNRYKGGPIVRTRFTPGSRGGTYNKANMRAIDDIWHSRLGKDASKLEEALRESPKIMEEIKLERLIRELLRNSK